MDAVEMTLLLDFYGDLLTERQRLCLDMRYNQDLSLGEIAQELGVSRQGVSDNLSRGELRMRNMEEKTGCVRRAKSSRRVAARIREAAQTLLAYPDENVAALAKRILSEVQEIED